MTFKERFRSRLEMQGKKIDMRYKDRPISKEKYEKRLQVVWGVIIFYLMVSFLCVLKVVGEWFS